MGVNMALDNYRPRNIIRELAKKTARSKMDPLETEKAQLTVQVTTMTQEFVQNSEEIRCYQAEQTVVLNRIQDLVENLGEIVNKAHLYNKLMETAEPSSARQTLRILVNYTRSMKDLLKEIHNLLPPRGTLRRRWIQA